MNQPIAPHAKRGVGQLRNGGTAAPVEVAWSVPTCGARTRSGEPCKNPCVRDRKRCRLHGGLSSGARTPEGRERARLANYRHGYYTQAAQAERKQARQSLRQSRAVIAILSGAVPSDLELESQTPADLAVLGIE